MVGGLNIPALQREFTELLIARVAQNRLFQGLKADIDAGEILPCLRKGEIHLYERGARLLNFSRETVRTHPRYARACIASVCGNRDVVLPDDLDADKFKCIHEAARRHRDKQPNSELAAVHKLFPEFAVTRSAHRVGQMALIDVEIRFGKDETDPLIKANMIDLAFLLPNRKLLFVEAKCIGNPAIIARKTAAVERQVASYERHIQRPDVLEEMKRSLCAQSSLVGRNLGHAADIFSRVPVLILNPTRNQNPVSKNNHWLRQALANAPHWTQSSKDVGIIDGMSDPIVAIREFAERVCPRES
jgi:hypothetical protein